MTEDNLFQEPGSKDPAGDTARSGRGIGILVLIIAIGLLILGALASWFLAVDEPVAQPAVIPLRGQPPQPTAP